MILSRIEEKKNKKKEKLLFSGYELFVTEGINNCSISSITKKAGVAKGTFYLYFSDKYDLLNNLILIKSSEILSDAINASVELPKGSLTERVLFIVDYVINLFNNNKELLKLIDKNLSLGVFVEAINKDETYSNLKSFSSILLEDFMENGYTLSKAKQIIFIVIEMVGSVCYSSIILEHPSTIDEIKPVLFEMIKKILDK